MSTPGWILLTIIVAVVLYGVLRWFSRYRDRFGHDLPDIPLVIPPYSTPPAQIDRADRPREPGHPDPQLFEGRTIRFYRPPAKTVKLLPGRLEVIGGEDRQEVIRFVRVPGFPAEVTLGRREGEPLRHIQFRAPTVSRHHALMAYVDSQWVITNLSATNPVVINGVELLPPKDRHVLVEGDEIEMGEVVFRFHER
jgi:hypothetical protein